MSRRDGSASKGTEREYKSKEKNVWVGKRKSRYRWKKGYKNHKYCQLYKLTLALLVSAIVIPQYVNAQYTAKEVLDVTVFNSVNGIFIESAVDELSLGNAIRCPSADTVIRDIDRKDWVEVLSEFRAVNAEIISRAKDMGMFKEPVFLAMDFHKVPRYRKKRAKYKKRCTDLPKAVGVKKERGTKLAHKIATIDVVGEHDKLTLDFEPFHPGSTYKKIVQTLVSNAKKVAKVIAVLADREFFNMRL